VACAERRSQGDRRRCGHAALIAVDFPKFTDGRGYSIARLLRDRYNFRGELRAIGDVLRDQLFALSECGFDAFASGRTAIRMRRCPDLTIFRASTRRPRARRSPGFGAATPHAAPQ